MIIHAYDSELNYLGTLETSAFSEAKKQSFRSQIKQKYHPLYTDAEIFFDAQNTEQPQTSSNEDDLPF